MSQTKQMDSGVHLKNGIIAKKQEPIGPPLNPVQCATVSSKSNGGQCQDMSKTKKSRICFNAEQLILLDNAFREYAGNPPKYILTQLSQQMGIPKKSINGHIKNRIYKLKRQRGEGVFKVGADPQLNYKLNESLDTQNPYGFVQYSRPSDNFDETQATQNSNDLGHSSHGVQDSQNSNNGFAHSSHGNIFKQVSHPSYNLGEAQATQTPNDLVPLSFEIHASQNPNNIRHYLSYGMQATQNPNGSLHPSHPIQVSKNPNSLVHSSHGIQDTQNPNNGFLHASHSGYNFGEVQATNNCFEYQNLNCPIYPSMYVEIALELQSPDYYAIREDEDNALKKYIADAWDQFSQLHNTTTQPISQDQQHEMAAELHEWLCFLSFLHRKWYE